MSFSWDDPVAWRDAMIPPVTFKEALKVAREARAVRFVWRGVTFDLGETEKMAPEPPVEITTPDQLRRLI